MRSKLYERSPITKRKGRINIDEKVPWREKITEPILTRHGTQRTKERLGISKKLADKNATKALRYGVRHADTSGQLHKYCDGVYLNHKNGNNLRIYNRHVYVFYNEILITVFRLPKMFIAQAEKLQKQRKENGGMPNDVCSPSETPEQ